MTRKQCKLCPWKVGTDPRQIPGGYDEEKHRALAKTLAEPGALPTDDPLRIMACHETTRLRELPCVGWLMNQLGEGNNIPLRIAVFRRKLSADVELVGPQHARLEDTFPR